MNLLGSDPQKVTTVLQIRRRKTKYNSLLTIDFLHYLIAKWFLDHWLPEVDLGVGPTYIILKKEISGEIWNTKTHLSPHKIYEMLIGTRSFPLKYIEN